MGVTPGSRWDLILLDRDFRGEDGLAILRRLCQAGGAARCFSSRHEMRSPTVCGASMEGRTIVSPGHLLWKNYLPGFGPSFAAATGGQLVSIAKGDISIDLATRQASRSWGPPFFNLTANWLC